MTFYKKGDTGVTEGTVLNQVSKTVSGGGTVYGFELKEKNSDEVKTFWTGFKTPDSLGFRMKEEVTVPWKYNFGAFQYNPSSSFTSSSHKKSGTTTMYNKAHVERKFPMDLLDPQRSIVRQNSLAHAVALYTAGVTAPFADPTKTAKEIVKLAKIFEEYSSGFDIIQSLKTDNEQG